MISSNFLIKSWIKNFISEKPDAVYIRISLPFYEVFFFLFAIFGRGLRVFIGFYRDVCFLFSFGRIWVRSVGSSSVFRFFIFLFFAFNQPIGKNFVYDEWVLYDFGNWLDRWFMASRVYRFFLFTPTLFRCGLNPLNFVY